MLNNSVLVADSPVVFPTLWDWNVDPGLSHEHVFPPFRIGFMSSSCPTPALLVLV